MAVNTRAPYLCHGLNRPATLNSVIPSHNLNLLSMSRELDIIILGATGYTGQHENTRHVPQCSWYAHITGRLIARYLEKHPERSKIKYAIAGRSINNLHNLAHELKLDQSNVAIIGVNISDFEELEALAKRTRLIINCVGPFALYSTPVVRYVSATSWPAPLNFLLQCMCADRNPLYGHHRGITLDSQNHSRVFSNVYPQSMHS